MTSLAQTPYYAVIFTSTLREVNEEYHTLDQKLMLEAEKIEGFLGMDSARSGLGISVSYWKTLEDIQLWRRNTSHIYAMEKGRKMYYQHYNVRICRVEREYEFEF